MEDVVAIIVILIVMAMTVAAAVRIREERKRDRYEREYSELVEQMVSKCKTCKHRFRWDSLECSSCSSEGSHYEEGEIEL